MFESGMWFWVWAVLAAFFLVAEIFTAAFFMMPFGIGAAVAAVLAFFDVGVGWQWAAFIVVSSVSVAALRHYSRRFTDEPPEKMGAERLVGLTGIVTEELIPHSSVGQVLVQREEWRADAPGFEQVPVDTRVIVENIDGTHLVVKPVGDIAEVPEIVVSDAEEPLGMEGSVPDAGDPAASTEDTEE